ncbi:MAG: hypothetical protein OXR72_12600 [Gemmatimonadota bacterium]|nr:hypothetical protein [Gemmatimonadota bacterium]
MNPTPSAPESVEPTTWEHYDLWIRVREAIRAVPDRFSTPTVIEGLLVTDIFTLNTPLAATIEEQVVKTLNMLRPVWDVNRTYQTYSFVRQPQTFPDVVLRRNDNGQDILMGIELKGWYLLAREGVPTYRFTATAAACNPWDILVVVPWVLSNVLAGSPVIFAPFIETALYCAQQRNYYWQYERTAGSDSSITIPNGVRPYPLKSDQISDKPAHDGGGNFGRIARYGVMNEYIARMKASRVRGIKVSDWLKFLELHASDI